MILIVEDNPEVAELFSTVLKEAGYEVEIADTIAVARGAAAVCHPELVLIDLSLPDGNGADLAVQLRDDGLSAPMIAVSGAMPLIDPQRLRAASFAATFSKPARVSAIVETIGSLLKVDI